MKRSAVRKLLCLVLCLLLTACGKTPQQSVSQQEKPAGSGSSYELAFASVAAGGCYKMLYYSKS